jgi:single-stranded-DNA-specific exonuclease
LLEALESCGSLFSRFGGHAHACGFAMPAANVPQLRAQLDQFAHSRLTLADFDPVLELEGELSLCDVTPELYQALRLLEPYGMSNPEPVFSARETQLVAPPRILKDKHVKLKLRSGQPAGSEELSSVVILTTPRCHPDGAAIRRSEKATAVAEVHGASQRTDFRSRIRFDALGWHMAKRLPQSPLLAGDSVDIAFSVAQNEHPEHGGLELSLHDLKACVTTGGSAHPGAPSRR